MNHKKLLRTLISSLMILLMLCSLLPISQKTYAEGILQESDMKSETLPENDFVVEVDADTLEADTYVISKTSITILTGDTYQLSITRNGFPVRANAWGSSDSSVATVDQDGMVTGVAAGSAVITAMIDGTTIECLVSVVRKVGTTTTRYNVLIMDASNSMKGTPLKREKTAAKRFCQTVLNSNGDNYLAVIALNAESKIICDMTDNYKTLSKAIDGVNCAYGTNLNAGLVDARKILASVPSDDRIMKNVILCSDGLPQKGTKSEKGHYTSKDHAKYYTYANAAYKTDVKIKDDGTFVYALGFFQNSKDNNLKFGKQLMKDLASKDKYYEVIKEDDIEDAMKDIGEKITSLTLNKKSIKIYVDKDCQLTAYLNGIEYAATWSTSDPSIAIVDENGRVIGIAPGTCIITAEVDGAKITCAVTIYDTPQTTLSKKTLSIYKGCTATLKATTIGISKSITWSSSDKAIAKVSKKGVVTGVKKGTCTVTAKGNGVKAKCEVTVKNPTISLNKKEAVLFKNDKLTLKATVHGKSKKVKWSSTKSSVASVDKNGKVTAKALGKCYIKATCNGVTAKCKITVEKKHPPYSFFINTKKYTSKHRGNKTVNEIGGIIEYNEGGRITKAGIYTYKSNGQYYFCFAVKGENLTSVGINCYEGLNGKKINDSYSTRGDSYHLNHFDLSRDSYDVYSLYGRYESIHVNTVDKNGKYPTITSSGFNGKSFKSFKSQEKLKEWIQK